MADNKKILIVDDEESIREILGDILEDEGYHIINAENGLVGIEKAAESRPDLIISDVQMPHMNGVDFLKGLPSNVQEMPQFVFLSGFCDISSDSAQNLGAQGIVTKPFDVMGIINLVDDFLLPPAEKWEFTGDYSNVQLLPPGCGSIDPSQKFDGNVIFGKDGLFFALDSDLPEVGAMVSFEIEVVDAGLDLKGVGKVAWQRIEPNSAGRAGIGVKFVGLQGGIADTFSHLVKEIGILSVIPNDKAPIVMPVQDCG